MARRTVFISHVSAEAEIAARLKDHLEDDFGDRLDFFVSSKGLSIEAGKEWLREIGKALRRACVEIVLCSPASVDRPWIHFEAGAGWIRGRPLIPVCHSGIAPEDLPIPLKLLQGVVVSAPEGLRELYEALASQIGTEAPKGRFREIAGEFRRLEAKLADVTRSPQLARLRELAARRGEADLLFHTFLGQEPAPAAWSEEAALSGRACVFRLWADAQYENSIQATLDRSALPRRVRIRFANQPGSLPGDVTIRPLGTRAMAAPGDRPFLAFDVRAPPAGQGNADRAAQPLAISVRVVDARATQWCYQTRDIRDVFEVPVGDGWRCFAADLRRGWVLFQEDGNHHYAAERPDFSVIGAVVIEVGTPWTPRLGPGAGEIEIARVRLEAEAPARG